MTRPFPEKGLIPGMSAPGQPGVCEAYCPVHLKTARRPGLPEEFDASDVTKRKPACLWRQGGRNGRPASFLPHPSPGSIPPRGMDRAQWGENLKFDASECDAKIAGLPGETGRSNRAAGVFTFLHGDRRPGVSPGFLIDDEPGRQRSTRAATGGSSWTSHIHPWTFKPKPRGRGCLSPGSGALPVRPERPTQGPQIQFIHFMIH